MAEQTARSKVLLLAVYHQSIIHYNNITIIMLRLLLLEDVTAKLHRVQNPIASL